MRKHFTFAACSLLALGAFSAPSVAIADTVTFNGTLSDSCTVTATGAGTMTAAANGLSMGTEETGGSAAGLSVSAVGTPPLVSFTAPGVTSAPAGYTGTPTASIKYSSSGASGQSTYTTAASSSQLTGLAATYAVNGKVADSSGLASGNYTMTTVATCSQGI